MSTEGRLNHLETVTRRLNRLIHSVSVVRAFSRVLLCALLVSPPSTGEEQAGTATSHQAQIGTRTVLSTAEIIVAFSDVLDEGRVQDQPGIHAETRWYATGHFETRWWRVSDVVENRVVNTVLGQWIARNDKRCVLISAAPQRDWECASLIFRADGLYLSLNPDGSPHGLHRLSALQR
jgi:hypothetical protein